MAAYKCTCGQSFKTKVLAESHAFAANTRESQRRHTIIKTK